MDLVEIVSIGASLILAIAAIVGLYLTRKQTDDARSGSKERNRQLAEQAKRLSEQNTHLAEQTQKLENQNRQLSGAVENLAAMVGIHRRQVEMLAQRLDALVSEQQKRVAIAERQLLAQQQHQNWNLLVGAGKLLGWAIDRGFLANEDDED